MADDRKRRRGMGDDERALIGRVTRRSPQEWPIHVDEEVTPPPQAVPIRGDVHEQLRMLGDGLANVTEAIGKVWNERGNSDRLDKLDKQIEVLSHSVHTWADEAIRHTEQIKALSTSVGAVVTYTEALRQSAATQAAQLVQFFEREWPRHEDLMERFGKALEDIAGRITRLEAAVDRLHSSDAALAARLTAAEATMSGIDVRLTFLERADREVQVRGDERRKLFTWGRAVLVGAGGAAAFVVEKLIG